MKKALLLLTFLSLNTFAQGKYLTKTGNLTFEASVPSFEEVKATNTSTTAILNTENGEFAALALVKGFRFKNALMEEHFNENYAESDEFPKAIFKGKISDYKLNNDKTTYKINGQLTFHGKTKTLENVTLTIEHKDDLIIVSGEFIAKASNYEIEIPKIVKSKVSEDIDVSFSFELKKK